MLTPLVFIFIFYSAFSQPIGSSSYKELCALRRRVSSVENKISIQDTKIAKQNKEIKKLNADLKAERLKMAEISGQIEDLRKDNEKQWALIIDELGENWIPFDGQHFLFVDEARTWKDALTFCIQKKGHLAEPSNASIDGFLGPISAEKGEHYWIGGSDYHSEGTWHWWSTAEEFDYTNWLAGEPNNGASGPKEDCLLYNWAGHGQWADAPCSWKKFFICSRTD